MSKTWIKILPYIVIAIMCIVIYVFWERQQALKNENDRIYHNMRQLIVDNNIKLLQLTKQELKTYVADTLFDKLRDSFDIKWRHIERTFNIKYHYTYDTTITLIKPTNSTSLFRTFEHQFDPCLSINGWLDLAIDSIHFNAPVQYNSTSVYFWKRPDKFWPIRWLYKKQNFLQSINNCSGKDTITEIQIIKKKN